jgi:hypothetical protein
MMLWAGAQFAKAQGIQFAPKRLTTDGDAMFLPKPLGQIDQSPAHNAIEIGNRTSLDRIDKRLALLIIQKRFTSFRPSRFQTIWTVQIETLNPVTDDLQSNPAQRCCLTARTTFVDNRQAPGTISGSGSRAFNSL